MEPILLPAVWTVFTGYLLWWMQVVKRSESMSADEAKVLWKIHKKEAHCSGQKWEPIERRVAKSKASNANAATNTNKNDP